MALLVSMLFAGGSSEKDDDETVTLTWWQIGTQPRNLEAAVEIMNAYSKEKINVEVDLKFADWGVWQDKISTMVNAGEAWDIMFTNGGFYNSHVAQGAYADITDSVKTVTPDLYNFIPGTVWPGVTARGRVYGVPTYKDSAQTQYWIWDKELVEEYDLDVEDLVTLAELDPVLREIQADVYPNGEGYIFKIPQGGINGHFMHYDQPSVLEGLGVRYDDETMTVVNVYEQDDIMEDLKILHEWYNDGLVPVDVATLKEAPTGRIAIGSAQAFPGAEAGFAANRDGHEVIMQAWSETVISTGTILGSVNAISVASPYQEEALKYLELVNLDPVFRNMYAYGIEGENFKDNGDGTVTKLNDTWSAPGYSQATFFTMSPIAPNSPDQWTMVKDQMNSAVPSVLLGFVFDPTSVETEIANCKSVLERYKFDLFSGTADPTELVPIIYEEMEKVGYGDLVDELQAQIDAWAGK